MISYEVNDINQQFVDAINHIIEKDTVIPYVVSKDLSNNMQNPFYAAMVNAIANEGYKMYIDIDNMVYVYYLLNVDTKEKIQVIDLALTYISNCVFGVITGIVSAVCAQKCIDRMNKTASEYRHRAEEIMKIRLLTLPAGGNVEDILDEAAIYTARDISWTKLSINGINNTNDRKKIKKEKEKEHQNV